MRIKLENVSKSFIQGNQIINDLNIDLDFNSLAIIGPSGGGKSTLLRIIAGLIVPSKGKVIVDGEEIIYTPKELLKYRRKIGFVFQSKGLFSHLTGFQNITLPLINVHKYSKKEAGEIADEVLDRLGLIKDKNKFPGELSGGQQQRVAIGRAIANKPKILLLDEPTSSLDPELTSDVLEVVEELKNDGLNIILVTHEMGFAKNACEKAVFLSKGNILECCKSKNMFLNPKNEELKSFLGKVLEWNV